uniref:Movement protein n=1 Tax=Rhabditophanes sp. KR3021 TaxID=114890 RepID=A0AC35TT64_9BILA
MSSASSNSSIDYSNAPLKSAFQGFWEDIFPEEAHLLYSDEEIIRQIPSDISFSDIFPEEECIIYREQQQFPIISGGESKTKQLIRRFQGQIDQQTSHHTPYNSKMTSNYLPIT